MDFLAVFTGANLKDSGSSRKFSLDLECYADVQHESVFRLTLADRFMLENGSVIYIDGTEWGGIVRNRETDTRTKVITWIGSTWHGMWAEKVLEPDAGQVRNTYSGSISGAIQDLITRLDLGDLFSVGDCPAGDISHSYTRYPLGWEALQEILYANGMRPTFTPQHTPGGALTVLVGAQSSNVGEIASSADMGLKKALRPPNHIIGLGKGEGVERIVIHRYADEAGNISSTPTFTGLEDRTIRYESPDSEYEDLLDQIDDRLADAQAASEISLYAKSALGIGDNVSGYDARIGESVNGKISACVVKASQHSLVQSVDTM